MCLQKYENKESKRYMKGEILRDFYNEKHKKIILRKKELKTSNKRTASWVKEVSEKNKL